MAFAAIFVMVSLLAAPAVYAVDHTVGGASGWDQGVDFATWAAGEKFTVGDNLIFNYRSSHSVDEVNEADYKSCTAGNSIKAYNGGQNTVPLTKSGSIYFLCPAFGHCGGGMKLSVTVAAASTPTPTTPSTPTPTTPATPKAGTPPNTPDSPTPPKETANGAVDGFGDMNKLVLGVSILLAGLIGFMG